MTQDQTDSPIQPLLDAYIRYLIAEKNLSPFTLRNYRTDILDFTRYMDENEDDAPLDADRQLLPSLPRARPGRRHRQRQPRT